jgi:hypothetical protein
VGFGKGRIALAATNPRRLKPAPLVLGAILVKPGGWSKELNFRGGKK